MHTFITFTNTHYKYMHYQCQVGDKQKKVVQISMQKRSGRFSVVTLKGKNEEAHVTARGKKF